MQKSGHKTAPLKTREETPEDHQVVSDDPQENFTVQATHSLIYELNSYDLLNTL